MNNWINKTVALNDTWGQGAIDTLSTPVDKLPQFSPCHAICSMPRVSARALTSQSISRPAISPTAGRA